VRGDIPRLPLKASLDLTYRCDNACRHCWLWTADTAEERARELSTDEWRAVIDQARALGVREWAFSGGEPMVREDFGELFEHAASRAVRYSLNTNGTRITPETARLLRRKGSKMVAVYGATAEVYDAVTRNPGGFEALEQGLAYLKEAGAGFTVQLIPMRDNWGQWDQMLEFARRWSRHYRVGAPWLYKSACGGPVVDAEIERQRLEPADAVRLDPPAVAQAGRRAGDGEPRAPRDDRVLAGCIAGRRDFHVDAYGGMTFCSFIKDPALRWDLRSGASGIPPGAVEHAWERFIPSLADAVHGGREYLEGCAVCDLREDCRWCDVYGYLEHGRHGARVEYLCAVAREAREYKERWVSQNRRYFEIAGVTVQVESDLPFADDTLDVKFEGFRAEGPGDDTVVIRQHFGLPEDDGSAGAELVHRLPPWAIFRTPGGSWLYHGISPDEANRSLHRVAVFSADHSTAEIYNDDMRENAWVDGGLGSLSMFPSDQIVLARLMADRQACFLHSGAVALDGSGLVFLGHSEAGKSTTMLLLKEALGDRVRILCDDRNIVREWAGGYAGGPPGFYVHGTWSHGDVPECSGLGVPLRAILFLEQSPDNEIVPVTDRKLVWRRLLATLIKPLVTAEWYEKELDVLERVVAEVPCFTMRFDKSGAIVPRIEALAR
jgi:uncharacterized Fe-S cluster-containing radical SAM superfamily protein